MQKNLHSHLSRRESQIMDVLYRLEEATVAEVLEHLNDKPAYNSVRGILRVLVDKGLVRYRRDEARRYVYRPKISAEKARHSALEHLVDTFFEGSAPKAAAALLDASASRLKSEDLEELSRLIDAASRRMEDE